MRFDATFNATSLRFDTSMDDRMARPLAGFVGSGWVELTDAGVVVHARRHRYVANLVGGAVGGVLGMVGAVWLAMDMSTPQKQEPFNPAFVAFGAVLGAFVTSLVFRFGPRVTVTIPWATIERAGTFGGSRRLFCKEGGDIQFKAPVQSWQQLEAACRQRGIRLA